MDLRQIRHFVAAAEEEHFSRGARRVNVVQSALSTSIRSLEDELGVQLFLRTTRRVRLTEAGRVLLARTRPIIEAVREAAEAMARFTGLEHGVLALGAVPSLPAFLDLARMLATFRVRHPGVEIRLNQGNASHLFDKLLAGELDVALLPLSESHPDIMTIPITREPLVLVTSRSHRLARQRSVSLANLADEYFVDFEPGWSARQLIDRAFAGASIERRTAFEVSDLDTMAALVCEGLGVAMLPRAVAEARRQKLAVLPILDTDIKWELVAAYPRQGEHGNAARAAFLGLLAGATIEMADATHI